MSKHFWFVFFTIIFFNNILNVSCQYYEEDDDFEEQTNSQQNQNSQNQNTNVDQNSEEAAPTVATTRAPTVNTTVASTPSPAHVIGQVNHVLSNVETLNISGIVDSALGIRNNTPIRNLVNGIIGAVFCNPLLIGFNNCGTRGGWGA